MSSIRTLSLPSVEPANFKRNFIRQAICELRFPTLFELEDRLPPSSFAKPMRKQYPIYERVEDININVGSKEFAQGIAHSFKTKDGECAITLRAAAINLETRNYRSFDDFKSKIDFMIDTANQIIDSNFFTRIGLRYINFLPFDADTIGSWVNQNLVGPLLEGVLGDVFEYHQKISGPTSYNGNYTLSHGVVNYQTVRPSEYLLDFDLSRDTVETIDAKNIVKDLHNDLFKMFVWTLGPSAKEYLGPSVLAAKKDK